VNNLEMSATASSSPVVIPNQYIVFYTTDADRVATNERLFFSSDSTIASSDSFSVVHEMDRAIAVTGISDAQYEELAQDPSVAKVIPVSAQSLLECEPSQTTHIMCHRTTK
jgi:hypothetical protein